MSMVLIIEDDHETRVSIRGVLEEEGFTVFSATNGAQGYALLQQLRGPVVVVLDQNMPLSSGEEFLHLKRKDKHLANVPVIVISAVGNRVAALGADEYLRKPFDLAKLVQVVRRYSPASFWSQPSQAG
jgi:DNA-binding response OmpR family regulator